jgi:hypothetical protein
MKRTIVLGLALGLAVAATSSAQAQIKIGVAGPITGGSAAFGLQLKNGVEQAVADINAAGGINGQKIQLFVGDDRGDPKEGVSVANKFAAEGVKFVVGHFNSGVTMPASEVYQGTWYSEDARFDGRTLQIHPQWIRFMDGTQELGAIRIEGVLQEGGGDGPIRFEIEGVDRDGQDTTLSFELVQRPTERLRLETQREAWRRTPRTEGST